MATHPKDDTGSPILPFMAGLLAGAAGAVVVDALTTPRRRLDPRLVRGSRQDPDLRPTIVVPGILGSALVRPDGSEAWLNLGNAFGSHDLRLPACVPLTECRDDLRPGGLLGADRVLPRLFGFTEYADLLELLDDAGFVRDRPPRSGAGYHVFTYDWRRDLVESARHFGATLEALASAWGDPGVRFNVVGHSMGGLVARYFLRYGEAEPGGPVTWAGARRIASLVLAAVPSGGSIPAFDSLLNGSRVGLSTTTLSVDVVSRLPAVYQLLPPREAHPLLTPGGAPLDDDLHDVSAWERHGWGPFGSAARRTGRVVPSADEGRLQRAFVAAALERARDFHDALRRIPEAPCPIPVTVIGGDCLPTLARAIVPDGKTARPRFEPSTEPEADAMFEAGDGRVTRASALASHLTGDDHTCGIPEVSETFLGDADHHGLYREPTFQSLLLRRLLRPHRTLERTSA